MLASVFVVFGCTQALKPQYTKFEPFKSQDGVQHFKYFVHANTTNPGAEKADEDYRINWLAILIADNELCSNGYEILERNEVKLGFENVVKDIYYIGQCK